MGFVRKGASAFGKLFIVIALAGTFIVGLAGVVYMSLQGQVLKVPEIVGKDFVSSEEELASQGLKIKRRADRYSSEKPNTILEQLPKAGDTVKTGQMIYVVVSKTDPEAGEAPTTIKKNIEDTDDSDKIEDLISDKPKKTNKANTNSSKKKSSTTRDVLTDNSNSNSNSSNSNSNSNSNKANSNSGANKNTATNSNKTNTNVNKAVPPKPVTGGDVRPRKTPKP